MGLLIVGFMAFFLLSDERKRLFTFDIIIKSIFFVFCGAQIYIFLFLKDVNIELSRTADFSYPGLWHSFRHVLDQATGGHFKGAMFPTGLTFASQINWKLNYIFLLIINFPSVFFIFGWFGLWKFFRRNPNSTWNIFFIFSLLSQAVWSASYLIWDMYAFALPVWVMFGLASAIGFDYVLKNWPNYRKLCLSLSITLLIGPFLYSAVPTWAQTPGFWKNYFSSFDRMANFWNAAEYFANPNKRNYDRVEVIANNFFSKMPPGAHFFDDDGKGQYPFSYYYQRLLHKRSDIVIHPIFSPQFDDTAAAQYAVQIKKLLERGNSVFISAIVFPERLILNHLYALMAQNSVISATYATGLSRERIIETFPKLAFQKFDLLPDASAYIYKIVLKDSVETRSSAEYLIEGESLSVIKKPAESYLAAQALDDRWSAEGHILSLENIKGAEYLFSIEIPRDLNGKILVRPTKSFDFGQVTFSLNIPDSKGNTIDLYSPNPIPSNEISLLQGKLSKGSYLLRVVIEGSNAEAVPKMGFGIDYLKIVEINSTD